MSIPSMLEKIVPDAGSSFTVLNLDEESICKNPHWHFHPEYEIVYISKGKGRRQIGNHVSFFDNGDLLVLGPHIPHYRFSMGSPQKYVEIAVQVHPSFLEMDFFSIPELNHISRFKEQAKHGLSYNNSIKDMIGEKLVQMTESSGFERLELLLSVLHTLAASNQYEVLNDKAANLKLNSIETERINKIYDYIESNYKRKISIREIAKEISLSIPYTCRFIKKNTNKTLTEIVNKFKVSKACDQLIESNLSISEISFEVGFNTISHFNRQFKSITGTNPNQYKSDYFRKS